MNTCDGLSLTEALVSLMIVTSASLALLQQQSHVSRYIHQINHRNEAMRQLDNVFECVAADRMPTVDSLYQLAIDTAHDGLPVQMVKLHWVDTFGEGELKRLRVGS